MSQPGHDPDQGSALAVLGVDPEAEAAYRLVVSLGETTVQSLAARLSVSEARAASVIGRLVDLGLVGRSGVSSGPVVAAPPKTAIDVLLRQLDGRLAAARGAQADLALEWTASRTERGLDSMVEIIGGAAPMARRFTSLFAAAEREVLGVVVGPLVLSRSTNTEANILALQRGIASRTIYEAALLEGPQTMEMLRECVEAGEQARVNAKLPGKLIVFDRETAVVPIRSDIPGAPPSAAIVHPPMVEWFVQIFENLWERSVPLGGAAVADGPEEADLEMLSLLLTGRSDDVVARQLGVTRRTVARRLARLMAAAGVENRMQLIWHATSRGWLDAGSSRGEIGNRTGRPT